MMESTDRYLKPAKATDRIRGVVTTKPSVLLRSSIKIRKSGVEVESEPGFFEGDTVAHCGPTLKGEFARTLNPLMSILGGCLRGPCAITPTSKSSAR